MTKTWSSSVVVHKGKRKQSHYKGTLQMHQPTASSIGIAPKDRFYLFQRTCAHLHPRALFKINLAVSEPATWEGTLSKAAPYNFFDAVED